MKIAIHHRKGSFSERWINYCKENDIDYKVVDCYSNSIVNQIKDCDVLMWHHHHSNYKDYLFAKELLYSIEQSGKTVFPNFKTNWHFDDKVGQKYLLEFIEAPLVPTYVFYDKASATKWVNTITFPKVFKLRGGAGATNVKLVKSKKEALKKINKAFGRGFSKFDQFAHVKDRYTKMKSGDATSLDLLKASGRLLFPTKFSKILGREKGYVYFQDFIPQNDSDTRVIVIGKRAFAIKRMTRKGDFRASGSGNIKYEKKSIDERCVKLAFEINKKVSSQCIAYDFVFNESNCPLIVEISFGFGIGAYDNCPGFWTSDLKWEEGNFNPQNWMIENVIEEITSETT